jgi:aldehyde dehydrogenase (NAD+)
VRHDGIAQLTELVGSARLPLGQILATGNTMVLKAPIETPWTALRWGRIIAEKTDIPPGVINVVTASDNDVAQRLVTDPRVDMISFTGSTAVGELIGRLTASTMKRNLMELGGKSVYLLLEDADLETTVPGCIGALMHFGQGCALTNQMLVPRRHYQAAVEMATATFGGVAGGDPADPANFCGPLVSAKQRERVLEYVRVAKEQGARVTIGGGKPAGLDRGCFVAPTILADVSPEHRVFQEEISDPSTRSPPMTVEMMRPSRWRTIRCTGWRARCWATPGAPWPLPGEFAPDR